MNLPREFSLADTSTKATHCLILLVALTVGCGRSAPVARLEVSPGTTTLDYPHATSLHLTWLPKAPLEGLRGQPIVFVHLLDRPGSVVRTFDHPLPGPWRVGEQQSYDIDLYQSALSDPLPAAAYPLSIGLVDPQTSQRWTLETSGEEIAKREYRVSTVTVPSPGAGKPQFSLRGGWLPAESGTDRQVLTRRWLHGTGLLDIGGVPGPGSILLTLTPAQPDSGTVRVSSSCGSDDLILSGGGPHRVSIAATEAQETHACEVSIQPDAVSEDPWGTLEVLAWIP